MSTSMSRTSATIYTFPPRGRYAIREQDVCAGDRSALPHGVKLSSGSGWYHEEAIQAALEASRAARTKSTGCFDADLPRVFFDRVCLDHHYHQFALVLPNLFGSPLV